MQIRKKVARFSTALAATLLLSAIVTKAAPIEVVDLASSSAWTLNGSAVTVPGNANIGTSATYQRSITIPASAAGKVVKVLFGCVNYGCEVNLNGTQVGAHKNLDLPFEVDLTGKVTAGQTYTLQVVAHGRAFYSDHIPIGCDWTGTLGKGIGRYAKLAVYPQVYIKDYFVRPSVKNDRLECDVWVSNTSTSSKSINLGATLSAWNSQTWAYPTIPQATATVPANSVTKITLKSPWGLGADSYWWANIPFSETYQAKLHYLNIDLKEGTTSLDTIKPRFGFVEYTEGPYYYMINGVRIGSQPSDGTSEAEWGNFAYSSQSYWTTACAESMKRYMRMGVNTIRNHSSQPTVQMMNVADEIGFWMIPESGIRGFEQAGVWDSTTYCGDVYEMTITNRNHPSICRYSVANEYNTSGSRIEERQLIDAANAGDPTRPLVMEGAVDGALQMKMGKNTSAHAFNMQHYAEYRGIPTRKMIIGMGEYSLHGWAPTQPCPASDLMREADMGLEMRKLDWAYFAIWDWRVHYGTIFLTEGSTSLAADKVWFMKRCLNPYVVCDSAYDMQNPCYAAPWPTTVPTLTEGSAVSRKVYLFNGGFKGNTMKLVWELCRGSATGALAATGTKDTTVFPGFYITVPAAFTVPSAAATATPINVTGGTQVYEETKYSFTVGGTPLYFVLRSYLMTPAKRFGVRPGVLELSGTGTLSGNIEVTTVDGTLPQLIATATPSWLSAVATGTGNTQSIAATASMTGQNPGIYNGTIVLSAAGYESITCKVTVQVTGGSIVVISPAHTTILPNGTVTLSAKLVDEIGVQQSAAFTWSTSGGGTISSSGLFTGAAGEGAFEISATVTGQPTKTAKARIVIAQGKALPATVLNELLILTNSANTSIIPATSVVGAIDDIIESSGSDAPCHGRIIYPEGTAYSWKTKAGMGGTFFSQIYSAGFASVTLLSPTAKSVKMSTTHYYAADVWRNGQKVQTFGGVSTYGGFDEATISLVAGANVMVFKQVTSNQGFFSVKFGDASTGAALTDVRYIIDTCGFEATPVALPYIQRSPYALCTVRSMPSKLVLTVTGWGRHEIQLISPRGQVIRSFTGEGSRTYQIPRSQIGPGFYVLRARNGAKQLTERLVVR